MKPAPGRLSAEGRVTALAVPSSDGPRGARRRFVRLTAVCASGLTALLVAACADRHTDATAATTTPRRLVIGIPSRDAPLRPLVQSLTELRLIRTDTTGRALPGLISLWRVSPDRLTWWLTVRAGVRVHTGTEATARDVATRLRSALEAATRLPGLWSVTAVDAPDPATVRVQLREPTSLLLEALSLVAVPAGPFAPETAEPEVTLRAVPQPDQVRPAIDSIELRRYDTPRAAVAAQLRGEIDVLYEVPSEARRLLRDEGIPIFPHIKPYVFTLALNHRHPALRQRAVRQALNVAVDRAALIAQEADGEAAPAVDFLWRHHWSALHATEHATFAFDRARARALLDQAGYPERLGPDGARHPRFAIKCLVLDDSFVKRLAVRLQRAYAEVGVALQLETLRLDDADSPFEEGRFEAALTPLGTGYGLSTAYQLFGRHRQPRMIDFGYTAAAPAAERVRDAASPEAFASATRDLHRMLLDDPPAVVLFWQETSRAVGRQWRIPQPVDGDVLGSLARWGAITPR